MRKFTAALFATAYAAAADAQSFMPENHMHLDALLAPATMTQADFNRVLDKAESYYKPVISNSHGKTLSIIRAWTDPTVNAYAYQSSQTWFVKMFGGLARRVSPDGLLAVACHEIGHHLAGYPFVSSWAANEGQSDYFSTLSCVRNIFKQPSEATTNAAYAKVVPQLPKSQCDQAWTNDADRNVCYRSMMAAKSLADLLSGGTARFERKDMSEVSVTNDRHPMGQCRLDTYVAAALCDANFDETVIPRSESESVHYTCNTSNGDPAYSVRPRCWFKPKL